ncbi:hypothetical protein ACE01N_11935 [Saccharicrinis sp. FJH2]|uniref:hypothetical protein n=1 Tax=Saccharicrinis sp. FJH65 TaxID=3344659 RepID=UPI0035F2C63D
MVRGLNIFKKYFEEYLDNYLIIGGAARDLIIENAGFEPKGTKDIDVILVVEALTAAFVEQFWQFVKDGNYEHQGKSSGTKQYYRFYNPANQDFPFMVELFSRKPDEVLLTEPAHLTPIPVESDLSSLSAILLSDDYYNYILAHSSMEDAIHFAKIESLICLKAKAFNDMNIRKAQGESVDSKKIQKHKNDIFRLAVMLTPAHIFELPPSIRTDLQDFASVVAEDLPGKDVFKAWGMGNIAPENVFNQILKSFQLDKKIES